MCQAQYLTKVKTFTRMIGITPDYHQHLNHPDLTLSSFLSCYWHKPHLYKKRVMHSKGAQKPALVFIHKQVQDIPSGVKNTFMIYIGNQTRVLLFSFQCRCRYPPCLRLCSVSGSPATASLPPSPLWRTWDLETKAQSRHLLHHCCLRLLDCCWCNC